MHPPSKQLPGPRQAWWLLCIVGLGLPLWIIWAGPQPRQKGPNDGLRFSLRARNAVWRIGQMNQDASAPLSRAATETVKGTSPLSLVDPEREADALMGQLSTDEDKELLIAHFIAVEQKKTALRLLPRVKRPSRDLQTALTALRESRDEPAPHPAALTPTEASHQASSPDFGAHWGSFVRERVRARVHSLAGERSKARESFASLQRGRETAMPLLSVIFQAWFLALVFGGLQWFIALVRVSKARSDKVPMLQWLTERHPGLVSGDAFGRDPLIPWLGMAAWMLTYLVGGGLIQALAGARQGVGLSVLFQGLLGAVAAAAILQTLSVTRRPLEVARLQSGEDATSPLRASTSALWAFCVMLPVVGGAALFNALVAQLLSGAETSAPHPVAGMLLSDPDALQIGALAVAVSVAAPLSEELIFRGLLFQGLRERYGLWPGVLASGLLFALVHGAGSALLPYWVLGCVFALVFEWTGTLWTSIILHGLWNLMVFGVMATVASS